MQKTAEYIKDLGSSVLGNAVFLDAAKKVVELASAHRLFKPADDLEAPLMSVQCEGQQAVALLQYKALLLGDQVLGRRQVSEDKQKHFKRLVGEFIGNTLKSMKPAGHPSATEDVVPRLGGFLEDVLNAWRQDRRPSCVYLTQEQLDRTQRCESVTACHCC